MPAKHTRVLPHQLQRREVEEGVCVCVWWGYTHLQHAWVFYTNLSSCSSVIPHSTASTYFISKPAAPRQVGSEGQKMHSHSLTHTHTVCKHAHTCMHALTLNNKSKLKDKTSAPAGLLSCSAFSLPLPLPLHCFLSQSHAEVERREDWEKITLPTLLLSSLLTNVLSFFSTAFNYTFPPDFRTRKDICKEEKDRHLIYLTAVITYNQRPSFRLDQTRREEKKRDVGVGGGGGGSPTVVLFSTLLMSIFHPENKLSLFFCLHRKTKRQKKRKNPPFAALFLCPFPVPVLFLSLSSYCPCHTGRHLSHRPLRSRTDLQSGRGHRPTETLLHDVLWLIEATFNLCWLPLLRYGEKEKEREREGGQEEGKRNRESEREKKRQKGDDGGGTDGVKRRRATTYN